MSSGPVGLDVREYDYGYFGLTLSANGIYTISARKNWLVTKIQLYMAANAGTLTLDPTGEPFAIPVVANGCLILEPNGAFRDTVLVSGNGGLLLVEYWFSTVAADSGFAGGIPVDVVNPP